MIKAIKVRLYPTQEQEIQLFKSCNIARWAYNWCLEKQNQYFESTGKLIKIADGKLRKVLTQLKKTDEFKWLYEVSNNVTKQAIKDCCLAIDRFHAESKKNGYKYRISAIKSGKKLTFKDFEDFPRFKKKNKARMSFYNDNIALLIGKDFISLEKIGKVKIKEFNKLPIRSSKRSKVHIINPRISFDNKYWYISIGLEQDNNQVLLDKKLSVGIDLGVKNLAIVSCLNKPIKNINKTPKVRKLKKRLKRLQKQVARKYEVNKSGNKFIKTNNIIKLEKIIKLLYRKLSNIRTNHIHQATSKIVKAKPHRVVMEDLNISGMMKNKYLSKSIQEQCFYEFIRQMKYKCEFNRIEFIQADRYYPSSKTCSCCGNIKKDLKLKNRVYICEKCGLEIDRDLNASINLANYGLV